MLVGGWLKDPYSPQDYLYKAVPRAVLPDVIDLNYLLPRDKPGKVLVRHQWHIGACVGYGLGVNLCGLAVELGIWAQQMYEWFSPTWIYNGARFIEGTLTQDLGCYPKDGLEWLLMNGTLLEHFWPYDPNKLDKTAPGSTRMAQAVKYKDFRYDRVVGGADGILTALNGGHLVSIGTPWFSKWSTNAVGNTGILPEVTRDDVVAGGHETCLYKADQTIGRFFGINSWGTDWGGSFGVPGADGGLYSMPFTAIEAFKSNGGYDAHVITFEKETVTPGPGPEPDPEPEPKPGCLLGQLGKVFLRGRRES